MSDFITALCGMHRTALFVEHGFRNRGIAGEICGQGRARLAQAIAETRPTGVHILCGINNVARQVGHVDNKQHKCSRNHKEIIRRRQPALTGIKIRQYKMEDNQDRKNFVFVMNCAAMALHQILTTSAHLTRDYGFYVVSTYLMKDDVQRSVAEDIIRSADVVVTQDVKSIDWLRNDNIEKLIKKSCILIRLNFWRFNGYWPIDVEMFNNSLWYLPNEFGAVMTYAEYKNAPIRRDTIMNRFDVEIEKFAKIDKQSDFSMLDYFLEHHQTTQFFSDSWHPTANFFFPICQYVMSQLGYEPDILMPANLDINGDRYRIVPQAVNDELQLRFDQRLVNFRGRWITEETFFYFSKFAETGAAAAQTPEQLEPIFDRWCRELDLRPGLINVSIHGEASQSSRSVWSRIDDPKRALDEKHGSSFAFHTEMEENPWWSVDLMATRLIEKIVVSNRTDILWDRAIPLSISSSHNGIDWTELARINFEFRSLGEGGKPLVLNLPVPAAGRHWKLEVKKHSCLHLDQVQFFARAISYQKDESTNKL